MAGAKKFGTFGGVFTPSILTILGVIMYMRLGWVVGHAGLYGAIILIVIAHVISVSTGLSISSISTDKKVGAGGVYYVLSRSLGLPIGGAIGMTLFTATALSIALYLIGFAESFNAYVGLDTSINGLRISGTVSLIILATIALISTAVAIKTQYFIMAAIGASLVSIFCGTWEFAPVDVPHFGGDDSVPMETIFAILFPAVTGFTAGIAMSGDLKDSKKSIPSGTIAAIGVGFVIYVTLAVFMAYSINPELLKSDYNVLMKIAFFSPVVVAGIWGATLSSALGGILGGPRIMQAMSVDKITPKIFAKGVGKDNEPWNALFITVLIAECGILIGELDMIARVVSMFYLAAYGFINLSFFLESWASADFSPSFRVKRWVGLVGFIATFTVMFKLDMMAMFVSFIIIGGIYLYLQRKELALGSGDIWHSVWSSLVMTGLRRMDKSDDHKRNWKPNILLFSGSKETRPHLIEIATSIAGKIGMVSNFHLIENPDATVLFPKHKQSLQDPLLLEHRIFGRQLEVQNVFQGIETIASTYGFSGVEPNTVMLGWAKNTQNPIWFAQMTQKLIDLDYNVLYLDYDWNKKFGKYQKIDIWWRNLKNNAELTLNIVKFILNSPKWSNASVRIILINDTNKEGFERKIHQQLDNFRVEGTVKVINNFLEKKSSFDIMKNISKDADLIIAGIPEIPEGQEKYFVDKTTEMFGILGTTLLVKTSTILGDDEQTITFASEEVERVVNGQNIGALIAVETPTVNALKEPMHLLTQELEGQATEIANSEMASFVNIYTTFTKDCRNAARAILKDISENDQRENQDWQNELLAVYQKKITRFELEDLPYLEERLDKLQEGFLDLPNRVIHLLPTKISVQGKSVRLRRLATQHFNSNYQEDLRDIQNQIGFIGYQLNEDFRDSLIQSVRCITTNPAERQQNIDRINRIFKDLLVNIKNRHLLLNTNIGNKGRTFVNDLIQKIEHPTDSTTEQKTSKKAIKAMVQENLEYKTYWHKNQAFLSKKLLTDMQLQQTNRTVEKIGQQIEEEIKMSMFEVTKNRLEEAEKWLKNLEDGSAFSSNDVPEINQSLSYDDYKIEELMTLSTSAGDNLPQELSLISPDSLNDFAYLQGGELEILTIDAQVTYNFLIHEKLQQPLQKHLLSTYQVCMEILSKVQFDINGIAQKMNLLKREIVLSDLKIMTEMARAHLIELREQLGEQHLQKIELLNDITHTANSALNTASVIEHAVRILPTVQSNRAKTGIKKWLGTASNKAEALVDKYGNLILLQRNRIKSHQKQNYTDDQHPTDMHYELKQFVDNLTIDKTVAEQLPFYYKQLFIGKAAPAIDQLIHRERELEQAFSMLQSANRDEHAVVVLGEPQSGKSFFSAVVARQVYQGQVIKIQAPISGSMEVDDLIKTIQKQLKSKAKGERILEEAPENAIFLFEDIELWWDRGHADGAVIKFIVQLIEDNKSRFSFILNCNIYAFKIMEAQGLLEYLNASKIYLTNFDQSAVQDLLMQRHHAGGLILAMHGKSQDEIAPKQLRRLMEKYWKNSQGIVGIALHQWISNISDFKEDYVEMDFPKEQALPELTDKELLIVLSQFLIHKHLDASRLQRLFKYEDRTQADLIIKKLSADGVIQDTMGSTYALNPLVLPWVIKRANEFSLI